MRAREQRNYYVFATTVRHATILRNVIFSVCFAEMGDCVCRFSHIFFPSCTYGRYNAVIAFCPEPDNAGAVGVEIKWKTVYVGMSSAFEISNVSKCLCRTPLVIAETCLKTDLVDFDTSLARSRVDVQGEQTGNTFVSDKYLGSY